MSNFEAKIIRTMQRITNYKKNNEHFIFISPKLEGWQNAALTIWMVLWTICGGYIILQLFGEYSRETKLMFFIYTAFWLYFENYIVRSFLWHNYGSENIKITDTEIYIKRDVKGFGRVAIYQKENIKNWRKLDTSKPTFSNVMGNSFWSLYQPTIAFDYISKEVRMANHLTSQEIDKLFKILLKA